VSIVPSAATALCGVMLHPAGHTRSPALHHAAYAVMGIDGVFVAFDVPPVALEDAMRGVRALGVRLLAVSLPHKEAVMALVDEVDEAARAIGAVNTVVRQGERLVGHNTDWLGVVRPLERERALRGARAVVLGAGGTARAAVHGLLVRGARVTVLNRTPARAEALARALGAMGAGSLDDLADLEFDVLVNTTRVGMREDASPVPPQALTPGSVVMDAVYDPPETRLLREARERGARTVGGKWMLVLGVAEQIRLWTGREPPLDAMARAFDAAGEAGRG